jgi:hypothetical protein
MTETEIVSVKAYHCFKCHATSMKPFPQIPPNSGEFHHYTPLSFRGAPEDWCFERPREVVIRTVEGENGA